MKKIIIAVVLLFGLLPAQAKVVRFAVNVSNTVVAQNDMYLTSSFQTLKGLGVDWQSGFLHMTQSPTDTNVYYYAIDLPAFQAYEYQAEKGSTGYEKEWVPVESRSPNDYRWIYLDSLNADTLKLPEVLFGENNTLTDTMYRFQVKMSSEVVSANGVHVAFDFQGNDPSTTRMYSWGNDVYEYMAFLTPAAMVHFRYFNGNTAADGETVPAACAMGGKRMINSVTSSMILPLVCFNSCSNVCQPASVSNPVFTNIASLSPNPMSGSSRLSFNDGQSVHQVRICDMFGKVLQSFPDVKTPTLDIAKGSLSSGVYYLQIFNEGLKHTSMKLIVE